MRHKTFALCLAIGLLSAGGGTVVADGLFRQWSDSEINSIRNEVDLVRRRTVGLLDTTNRVEDLQTAFENGAGQLSAEARAFIEDLQDEAAVLMETEVQRYQAFLESDQPEAVRQEMLDLVTGLEETLRDQMELMFSLDLPCTDLQTVPTIDLDALREVIASAPEGVFYPIHRVTELLGGDFVATLLEHLACARDALIYAGDLLRGVLPHEEVVEKIAVYRSGVRAIQVAAWLMKKFGPELEAFEEIFEVSFEFQIWGWVGGSLDVDLAYALGKLCESLHGPLAWIAGEMMGSINHSELIVNQQQILSRLPGNRGRGR